MKKIFTFLFCIALISTAFAQEDHSDWNRRSDGDNRDYNYRVYSNDGYNHYQREQIERINYKYDYQVQGVMDNWSLSPWQKRRAIDYINDRRAREINSITWNQNHYGSRHRHHHDDDDDGD